jgi:type IV pilus assembly protein PilQ
MNLINLKALSNISIKKCFLHFLICLLFNSNISAQLKLESIDYFIEGDIGKLQFSFNEEGIIAKRFHVNEDKQIVLDLSNVEATDRVLRSFDTSEFSGSVVYVAPYKRNENDKDVRVTIQLRDNVRSLLETKDNKLIMSIENRFGVFSKSKMNIDGDNDNKISKGESAGEIKIPKSQEIEDILENLTQSGIKKYVGKKISFNVKDVSFVDLLKMIATASGFNIIMSDDVEKVPRTTLSITDIPWDQALDTVLNIGKLVATKNGNILLVTTLERATAESRVELLSKEMNEKNVPLVTKIFPISFAKLEDLVTLLKEYITEERGVINQDARTNSLIIKDTADVIEKIKKIIETLDTQTPQILIEAKIVEASEEHAKEIGLKNGIGIGYDPIGASIDPGAVVADPTAAATTSATGFSFSSAPISGEGGSDFFSFIIPSYRRLRNLDFRLQLMESESKAKVVTSPRIITENKKPATIDSTESTNWPIDTMDPLTGRIARSFQKLSALLKLTVTPNVTNDGSIVMDVNLSRGTFGSSRVQGAPPDQFDRNLETRVLVDNGSTVVLGGIYNYNSSENSSGIPILKDLPLLGWLFKTPFNPSQKKSELMIFLTPRIVNQEEAGLSEKEEAML